MFFGEYNSKAQGNIGLGMAIAYFTAKKFIVSIPLNDSQSYDLVVDMDGSLKRVQVKTTSRKKTSSKYEVELRSTGGNKSRNTRKHFDNTEYSGALYATCPVSGDHPSGLMGTSIPA